MFEQFSLFLLPPLALIVFCGWKLLSHCLERLGYILTPEFRLKRLQTSFPTHQFTTTTGPRKKIAVVAVGSTGDMHVYTALAMEFKKRGHTVALLAEPSFRSLAVDAGLEWLPLEHASVKSNMAKKFDADFVHASTCFHRAVSILTSFTVFCR